MSSRCTSTDEESPMQIGLYAVPRPGALDDKSLLQVLSAYLENQLHSVNMHAAINQYLLVSGVSGHSSAFLLALLSPVFSLTCT